MTVQTPVYNQLGTFPAPGSPVPVGMAQAPGYPGTTGPLFVSADGIKPCFRASAINQAFVSAAVGVLIDIQGSATKTVRVKQITIWAQAATKSFAELTLLRSTTISASGTPVVAVIGAHDPLADGTATAVVNGYTAAATVGAGHLVTGSKMLSTVAPSATCAMIPTVWDFCADGSKGFILRGVGDVLEVVNNTLTLGTATYGFEVVWEEDNS